MNFSGVGVGGVVVRKMAEVFMRMQVIAVSDTIITTSAMDPRFPNGLVPAEWTFDRATGAEIDHDLRWGPQYGATGSCLVEIVVPGTLPSIH